LGLPKLNGVGPGSGPPEVGEKCFAGLGVFQIQGLGVLASSGLFGSRPPEVGIREAMTIEFRACNTFKNVFVSYSWVDEADHEWGFQCILEG
jgi:hypothetical protein